jgi:2-dehydro-3-deoxygalactonokinase
MPPALLACDWGTTNLRAWVLDEEGVPLQDREFPLGVSTLGPGEAERRFEADVRGALGAEGLPAILCGMIGSSLGWKSAPYAHCPASLDDLAGAMIRPTPDARIVPGLRCQGIAGSPDVMRGEETQVFGWLTQRPERRTGRRLVLHPGTHAKWVLVEEGKIMRFVTVMTGELFAVLRRHSVLRSDGEPDDAAAFEAGVASVGDGGALGARLFTARSRVVGGGRPAAETPSYLSGLLIGAELASTPALLNVDMDEPIALLGDARLCGWYARALTHRGIACEIFDGEAAALAGLLVLHRLENAHAPG